MGRGSPRSCAPPLVSYDHILAKLTEPAAEAPDTKGHPAFQRIPYEFFFFTLEETMRSSARFLADYIFSDQIAGLLDRLTEQYGTGSSTSTWTPRPRQPTGGFSGATPRTGNPKRYGLLSPRRTSAAPQSKTGISGMAIA